MKQRGDFLVAELLDGFDQSRHPGGAVEMADVGLAGAEGAEGIFLRTPFAEGLGERGDLDGIAERGAGAVGFDVGNFRRTDPGGGLGEGDDVGLGVESGRGETDLVGAVVVDGPAFDHGEDRVAVGDGLTESFQQDNAAAVAENRSGGIRVEGAAGAVRRDHAFFLEKIIPLLGETDGHAAGERHVALVGEQGGGGLADRDQRGGARRLDRHARAAEVELVGDADRQEILVVSEHRLVFGNLIVLRQLAAFAEIVEQVGVQAEARVNADHAGVGGGIVAGAFERFPRAFEENPVLRVHQLGFLRVNPEERGVELVRILEHAARADVFAAVGFGASGEAGDAVLAGHEILPEFIGVLRAGESACHADDGDGFGCLDVFVHRLVGRRNLEKPA